MQMWEKISQCFLFWDYESKVNGTIFFMISEFKQYDMKIMTFLIISELKQNVMKIMIEKKK